LVECQLPKLDVAGSSPVARSEIFDATEREPRCAGAPGLSITKAAGIPVPQLARSVKRV
jgi:hypothetical protein